MCVLRTTWTTTVYLLLLFPAAVCLFSSIVPVPVRHTPHDAEHAMDYRLLANPRIRQEAQRCLQSYHEAHRRRRATVASTSPRDGPSHGPCWRFYRGELTASPGKEHVDDLLIYGGESSAGRASRCWSPEVLEYRHDYIQWLFPLRERGVNWLAPLLTTAEAVEMQQDGLVMARVLQAFRTMLRFYGTDITYTVVSPSDPGPAQTKPKASTDAALSSSLATSSSPLTQAVYLEATLQRTSNPQEWAAQYDNFVHRSHNYLRVSRILQFLGEVGLEPLKLGWLEYFAREVMTGPPARAPLAACRGSFFFWMETPYEEEDRVRLQKLVEQLASNESAPTATAVEAPVVVVKGLVLPSTLDVSRVVGGGPPGTATTTKSARPSAPENRELKCSKGPKRQRE